MIPPSLQARKAVPARVPAELRALPPGRGPVPVALAPVARVPQLPAVRQAVQQVRRLTVAVQRVRLAEPVMQAQAVREVRPAAVSVAQAVEPAMVLPRGRMAPRLAVPAVRQVRAGPAPVARTEPARVRLAVERVSLERAPTARAALAERVRRVAQAVLARREALPPLVARAVRARRVAQAARGRRVVQAARARPVALVARIRQVAQGAAAVPMAPRRLAEQAGPHPMVLPQVGAVPGRIRSA